MDPQQIYTPLPDNSNHTRLLRLLPGTGDEKICCELIVFDLDSYSERYVAVSYTWGPDLIHTNIILDGSNFPVRKNLFDLLLSFRQAKDAGVFWIDALCINQTSVTERNQQVDKMGRIFGQAMLVRAWLGTADKEAESVLKNIKSLAEVGRMRVWPIPEAVERHAESSMRRFQALNYWTRAWIVQELVLAVDVLFCWGQNTLSLYDLEHAVSMTRKDTAKAIRAIMLVKTHLGEGRIFTELFDTFGQLQCAMMHDKLYSLYGMAKDRLPRYYDLPKPDYSLCITEVFMQHVSRWRTGLPTSNAMHFVLPFTKHFRHQVYRQNLCLCHNQETVTVRLPLRGVVRTILYDNSSVDSRSPGPGPLISIGNSKDDIYRHRRFRGSKDCMLQAEDVGFYIGPEHWTIIAREDEYHVHDATTDANGAVAATSARAMKLVGFVQHEDIGTSCIGPMNQLGDFTNTQLHLEDYSTTLMVTMRVNLLIQLGLLIQK